MAEATTPKPAAASSSSSSSSEVPTTEELHKMNAEEREKVQARTRGVSEQDLATLQEKTKWYVSNRGDDRTVLWERDPRHPSGEILIGGSSPSRAYLTPGVQEALRNLLLVEVPEPQRTVKDAEGNDVPNRKYPVDPGVDAAIVTAAQPGQPTPLGRKLDPELWSDSDRAAVAKKQADMPSELPVPSGAVVGGA